MNRLQKIFMGLLILAVISLAVYSQIQTASLKEAKLKVIDAENQTYNNLKKAKEIEEVVLKIVAEANMQRTKAQLLAEQLEACKGKK